MKVAALIVAGGSGSRVGGDVPKQYRLLAGEPLLRRTLRAFAEHPEVDLTQCVIGTDAEQLFADAARDLDVLAPVAGGATRQASVLNGLRALEGHAPDIVLIHDGARPFVSTRLISEVITASSGGGALPALNITDTLKLANGSDGPDRDTLCRAQTPQGFPFRGILAAHQAAAGTDQTYTDDIAIARAAGLPVTPVRGEEDNIKVTFEDDFARAERIAAPAPEEFHTGFGYDVHRFASGDQVILGGVPIPHTHKLAGHSDADVVLHTLTDAVLGTIGEGDIGTHFPPSNAQWKGASSDRFLAHACALVAKAGGRIVRLDATVICEAPKVGPHREAMRYRIAEICGIAPTRVSIKATTTEKLGFTGRGEGIAAQAVATVALPGDRS